MLRFFLAPHHVSRYTGLALAAAAIGGTAAWGLPAGLGLLGAGAVFLYRAELREWGLHRLFWPRVWFRHPLLGLGLALVLLLLAAAYFPAWLAPHDPDVAGPFLLEVNGQTFAAPYPPNPRYPLGSDHEARDLLSRVIFGTRATLTLVVHITLVRMGVGIGLGILAALPHAGARQLATTASTVSAAFPSLLFAFIFIAAIGPGAGMPVFILGLGLTGWAHWTRMVGTEVQRIRAQPYLLAAEAVGTPPTMQFRRHVLPGLLPLVLPSVAHELSAAMLLLAELGFIGVFFGEAVVINITDLMRQTVMPEAAEWGGMLAGTRAEVFRWYWLPLVPAGAFLVSIMGFNWLASGLQHALDPAHLAAWSPRTPVPDRTDSSPRRPLSWSHPVAVACLAVLVAGGGMAAGTLSRLHRQTQALQQEEAALAGLREEAQHALSVNRYETARTRFQAYLRERPDDPEAQAGLAQAEAGLHLVRQLQEARRLAGQDAWTEALPLLRAIHALHPNYGGVGDLIAAGERRLTLAAQLQSAQAAYAAGNWSAAIQLLEQVQEADREFEWQTLRPLLADSYRQQAFRLLDLGGYSPAVWADALALLDRAQPYHPNDAALQAQRRVLQGMLQAHQALAAADELTAVEALALVHHAYPVLPDARTRRWWRLGLEVLGDQAQDRELALAEIFLARLSQGLVNQEEAPRADTP